MTPTDYLAIIGAITGVIALAISALYWINREQPILRAYEIYTRPNEGATVRPPRSRPGEPADNKGELIVHLHLQVTNSGLRPTRIIKAGLLVRGKHDRLYLGETKASAGGGIIASLTGLLKDNQLRGARLGPGDFVDDFVDFNALLDPDFVFGGLRADLSLEFSHTRRPLVVRNIPIQDIKTADANGHTVPLETALDTTGRLK